MNWFVIFYCYTPICRNLIVSHLFSIQIFFEFIIEFRKRPNYILFKLLKMNKYYHPFTMFFIPLICVYKWANKIDYIVVVFYARNLSIHIFLIIVIKTGDHCIAQKYNIIDLCSALFCNVFQGQNKCNYRVSNQHHSTREILFVQFKKLTKVRCLRLQKMRYKSLELNE